MARKIADIYGKGRLNLQRAGIGRRAYYTVVDTKGRFVAHFIKGGIERFSGPLKTVDQVNDPTTEIRRFYAGGPGFNIRYTATRHAERILDGVFD